MMLSLCNQVMVGAGDPVAEQLKEACCPSKRNIILDGFSRNEGVINGTV